MHEQLTLDLWPDGDPNPLPCCENTQALFPHLKYQFKYKGMTGYCSSPKQGMHAIEQLKESEL